MSKSKGNVIPALNILDKYGENAVRFYFLKEGPLEHDEIFNANHLVDVYNAHVVNELSNSVRRVSSEQFLPPPGTPFTFSEAKNQRERTFITQFNEKARMIVLVIIESAYETSAKNTLQMIISLVQLTNQYLNSSAFWNTKDKQEQYTIIGIASEALRIISILMYPVIPKYAEALLGFFEVAENERNLQRCKIEIDKASIIKYNPNFKVNLFNKKLKYGS